MLQSSTKPNKFSMIEHFHSLNSSSTDLLWNSSDDQQQSLNDFYPDSYSSSSSSLSSIDLHSNTPNTIKTFSSSSGYESSFADHYLSSSPNSINELFSDLNLTNSSQLSNEIDDDSQLTQRPRSLPIAIQQNKIHLSTTSDDTDTESMFSYCTDNHFETKINSLEHFIMSPTDEIKIQIKYQQDDAKNLHLQTLQPEFIDFKRSKIKAIRVLYQNRLQSPVTHQNSTVIPFRTTKTCDSPLAKRTNNPRLFRSVISFSVFEADDEHEVDIIRTRTGAHSTNDKSRQEISNHFLRINFIESLLHGKILPCGILDGFTIKLGACGLFIPKQIVLPVTTFWFNVSEHQAASPYLGFVNLQCLPKRGYHTPNKGTITLALLNPNGTAIHLFLILYDLSDMPADHRTFIRQRIVLTSENSQDKKVNLRYLAHIRFVTSQTGKLYMHSDIRLIFARNKLDYDERADNTGKPQLVTYTDMPTPKYWPRK